MDDVVSEIVIAVGDEYLLAGDFVGVAIGFSFGFDEAYVGACVGFR
jgi:uncharacterized protein YcsI (UPF0317 family)